MAKQVSSISVDPKGAVRPSHKNRVSNKVASTCGSAELQRYLCDVESAPSFQIPFSKGEAVETNSLDLASDDLVFPLRLSMDMLATFHSLSLQNGALDFAL